MDRSPSRTDSVRASLASLHRQGTFVIPNVWDAGSARIVESLGFPAIATTSSGFGASLGRMDQQVTLDELVRHVRELASAVEIPLSVDAENCYASNPAGVTDTVRRVAEAGAAGISIEDYDPAVGLYPLGVAVERVGVAAAAAKELGLVLTARAENHLYGVESLDDTLERLRAYRDAGADVVYAPGLIGLEDIARLVEDVAVPVNVLLLPSGPGIADLTRVGVRRISVGGALAFAAYGALARAARQLLRGEAGFLSETLTADDRRRAFDRP